LRKGGDQAVLNGLRGRSNHKIKKQSRQQAIKILSGDADKGSGPTLACEYLEKKHKIFMSRKQCGSGCVKPDCGELEKQPTGKIHMWRVRRERWGEMVQWDTSEHDWLEGRGEQIYLIKMIGDATSRLFARFVRSDSTAENMGVLEQYCAATGDRWNSILTPSVTLLQVGSSIVVTSSAQRNTL
jgi:hypothetical protein